MLPFTTKLGPAEGCVLSPNMSSALCKPVWDDPPSAFLCAVQADKAPHSQVAPEREVCSYSSTPTVRKEYPVQWHIGSVVVVPHMGRSPERDGKPGWLNIQGRSDYSLT